MRTIKHTAYYPFVTMTFIEDYMQKKKIKSVNEAVNLILEEYFKQDTENTKLKDISNTLNSIKNDTDKVLKILCNSEITE
ncbi:hypothetical protein ACOTJJ_30265 [Achromobacter xylosoxidans]